MKKLLYTFLAVSLIFSACEEEDIVPTVSAPTIVNGCMDPAANNYNSSATNDDGSCISVVSGCTNASADNYNADANTDDNSCEFSVVGCMDVNYQEYADTYVDNLEGILESIEKLQDE